MCIELLHYIIPPVQLVVDVVEYPMPHYSLPRCVSPAGSAGEMHVMEYHPEHSVGWYSQDMQCQRMLMCITVP